MGIIDGFSGLNLTVVAVFALLFMCAFAVLLFAPLVYVIILGRREEPTHRIVAILGAVGQLCCALRDRGRRRGCGHRGRRHVMRERNRRR
jgi:hypothetical protein